MRFKWWLALLLLSFFSFRTLLRPGYFPMHDDMQPVRLLEMDKCLKDGQFPCRWSPDLGYGYGYPLFLYYSPLAYYLMEIIHKIGFSILDAIKAEFTLSFIFSGAAMFLLASSLWGNWGGLISAIAYVYAPFRAADVYTRGAVGELTAFIFPPLIFWSILEFFRKGEKKYCFFLAFSLAGIFLTHNISSLIFVPVAGLWLGFLAIHYRSKKAVLPLVLASAIGVGMASFFLVPALLEKNLVHVETMLMGYFNYLAHFVSLRQFFFSTHWGFGSSELGSNDDLSFAVGLFHWIFAGLAVLMAVRQRKNKPFCARVLFFMALVFVMAAFLTHQRSVFIWNKIRLLSYLQFPWRFLTLATFCASLMVGGLSAFTKRAKLPLTILLLFFLIGANAFYFRPSVWLSITDQDKFSGDAWQKQITASIYDYLPVFARHPPAEPAPTKPLIFEGQGEIIGFEKGTDWQRGSIRILSASGQVRLPLFYFPRMKLLVDGQKKGFRYDNELGLITFSLPAGEHDFYVKLKNTTARTVGDILTVFSLMTIISWFIYERKKKN